MKTHAASYKISGAKFKKETESEWVIGPGVPAWINPLLGGLIFGFFALVILYFGNFSGSAWLFGIPCLSIGFAYLSSYPLAVQATFDFTLDELNFTADYLLRNPRHVAVRIPLSEVVQASFRRASLWEQSTGVNLMTADGTQFTFIFGRASDAARLMNEFTEPDEPAVEPSSAVEAETGSPSESAPATAMDKAQAVARANAVQTQFLMARELHSWRVWLFILGIIQMVAAGGFSPWGALLIVVGLVSFYFKEAAMFAIYAVTLGWAAISNLFGSGEVTWNAFAIVQFLFTYQTFQQFLRFRRLEKAQAADPAADPFAPPPPPSRAGRIFPWAALGLGISTFFMFWGAVALIFVSAALSNDSLLALIGPLENLAVFGALLGFGAGLASWISAFKPKGVAVAGCIFGALTLISELIFPVVIELLLG